MARLSSTLLWHRLRMGLQVTCDGRATSGPQATATTNAAKQGGRLQPMALRLTNEAHAKRKTSTWCSIRACI
jgi:hypothetical protein